MLTLQPSFAFVPPAKPASAAVSTKLDGEFVAVNCGIVRSSEPAVWGGAEDDTRPLAVFVATVLRMRDSYSGALVIGPKDLARLSGVVAALGGGADGAGSASSYAGSERADSVYDTSGLLLASTAVSARALFSLVRPYLVVACEDSGSSALSVQLLRDVK